MTSGRVLVCVVLLAAAGLFVSLAAAWPGPDTSTDPSSSAGSPRASARPATPSDEPETDQVGAWFAEQPARRAAGSDPSAAPPAPDRVRIPAIGVTAPVRPVGVAGDRQMQLPGDPDVVGWYRFGPAPGAGAGSVVLAGHLDSVRFGVGVLARLRNAAPGDLVQVRSADDVQRDYRVTVVDRFDRQGLPARVFRRTGPETLTVITCGGDYDAEQGGYQQNLVVTARPS